MSTAKYITLDSDEFSPREIRRRMTQCDHLYSAGKRLAWARLRRDYPSASDEELEQRWQALLEDRKRGKWGSK